ncbi:hypothetical protein FQN54_000562 [Arachnomyces sp. PD_36]|nr:hypothetical protein FQN54_000562 [Arachnomyces sp. PD_36]
MSLLPPFQHQPLPSKRHIRLLELELPDNGTTLRASVHHVGLDDKDAPSYAALSYTWGEPIFSEQLVVNEALMGITSNLAAALRQLRSCSCLRWLWIDAICINQSDEREKSSQIPLMTDIFYNASHVWAWLGDEPEAIGLLRELRSLSRSNTAGGKQDLEVEARLVELLFPKLVELSWFSRRWIIQEVALNPTVLFLCGSAELPLARLVDLVGWSRNPPRALFQLAETWKGRTSKSRRGWNSDEGRRLHIIDLMEDFRAFRCSDTRDYIFSLLGMSNSTTSYLDHGLKVDYSVSVEEIYVRFAEAALLCGDGHKLLRSAEKRPREHSGNNLPSWVPDWRILPTWPIPLHADFSARYWKYEPESEVVSGDGIPVLFSSCSRSGFYHIVSSELFCFIFPGVNKDNQLEETHSQESGLDDNDTRKAALDVLWTSKPLQPELTQPELTQPELTDGEEAEKRARESLFEAITKLVEWLITEGLANTTPTAAADEGAARTYNETLLRVVWSLTSVLTISGRNPVTQIVTDWLEDESHERAHAWLRHVVYYICTASDRSRLRLFVLGPGGCPMSRKIKYLIGIGPERTEIGDKMLFFAGRRSSGWKYGTPLGFLFKENPVPAADHDVRGTQQGDAHTPRSCDAVKNPLAAGTVAYEFIGMGRASFVGGRTVAGSREVHFCCINDVSPGKTDTMNVNIKSFNIPLC